MIKAENFFDWDPNPYCLGCWYYRPIVTNSKNQNKGKVCHFLLDTGSMRGCKFGKGCTRRTEKPTIPKLYHGRDGAMHYE